VEEARTPETADVRDPNVRRWLVSLPGPTWREWFYTSFAKTYALLGLFIADAIVLAGWLQSRYYLGSLTLLPMLYVEFLLYQYLWHEPSAAEQRSRSTRLGAAGGRAWVHPVPYGRWSATARDVRDGVIPPDGGPAGPDPKEFL
jgi:hypothetical protein